MWEPKPMRILSSSHYLTVDKNPPTNPAILIKSLDHCEDDKPIRYTVISKNKDGYALRNPEGNRWIQFGRTYIQ